MCATSCQRLPYQPYPYYDSALQPPVSVFHQYTAHTAFQSGPAPASLLPVEHVAKVSVWRWSAPHVQCSGRILPGKDNIILLTTDPLPLPPILF